MDQADYYASLPRKIVAACALFRDQTGRFLLVKPTYKSGWDLPGGNVDADESPLEGCVREVREELGLEVSGLRLLCVDFRRALEGKPELLVFVFDGGILEDAAIQRIRIPPAELAAFRFVELGEIEQLMAAHTARRAVCAAGLLTEDSAAYLEDGRAPVRAARWTPHPA
jgi:8-oxo-dGTP pyrophosphatase MutT (NUDIX family)